MLAIKSASLSLRRNESTNASQPAGDARNDVIAHSCTYTSGRGVVTWPQSEDYSCLAASGAVRKRYIDERAAEASLLTRQTMVAGYNSNLAPTTRGGRFRVRGHLRRTWPILRLIKAVSSFRRRRAVNDRGLCLDDGRLEAWRRRRQH